MKKKELTLEQLKRIRKIATIIVVFIYFTGFINIIARIIIGIETNFDKYIMLFVMTMFIPLLLWMFFDLRLEIKIRKEQERLRVAKIKNKAKEGNLKNVVVLKSENIQNKILVNNIEKILFKGKDKTNLIVEIYLKSGLCLPLHIQAEKVLSILSSETKEEILENVVDSITIEDLEKSTMQVHINTKGYTIDKEADDYNLISWFELKK